MGNGEWNGKIWNRKKSGEGYASHLRVSSIRDEDGQIRYFIGVSDDITQQMLVLDGNGQPNDIDILTELPNRPAYNYDKKRYLGNSVGNMPVC